MASFVQQEKKKKSQEEMQVHQESVYIFVRLRLDIAESKRTVRCSLELSLCTSDKSVLLDV